MASNNGKSQDGSNAPGIAESDKALFAASLLLAVVAALGLRGIVSPDALAPAVATLLFSLAAAVGGMALLLRRRPAVFDLAGILTFVGIIVSLMIESDQMTRLIALSEQQESN